jgi:hypothetical protein
MPAPVALLMHVCRGAHEMPLPQSVVRRGKAETLQTSIATMNNDAFAFIVFVCCLSWLYFYYLLLLIIKMDFGSVATRRHNSQLVTTVVSAFVRSCAAFAARGGLVCPV